MRIVQSLVPRVVTFFSNGVAYRGAVRPAEYDRKYRRGLVMYANAAEEDQLDCHTYPALVQAMQQECKESPYTQRGDYPRIDKAWDAMNREIVRHKTRVMKDFLRQLGLDPADLTIAFSRKAGCSCGCSPGFRVTPKYGWLGRFHVWCEPAPLALPPSKVPASRYQPGERKYTWLALGLKTAPERADAMMRDNLGTKLPVYRVLAPDETYWAMWSGGQPVPAIGDTVKDGADKPGVVVAYGVANGEFLGVEVHFGGGDERLMFGTEIKQ
jgi:hypothetical protein